MESCLVENCAPTEEKSNLKRSAAKLPKPSISNLIELGLEIIDFQAVWLQMMEETRSISI